MISHGKDIKVFCGNANQPLAAEICQMMGTKLGESEVKSFADGEVSVSLYETVRGSDVFLINSTCKPVNDSLMELLIMIDACKRASAGRVTAYHRRHPLFRLCPSGPQGQGPRSHLCQAGGQHDHRCRC